MKLHYQLTLVTLLGVSCGKQLNDFLNMGKMSHKKSVTDIRFEDHVIKFENEFNTNVNVPIIFKELEGSKAGACYTWSDGYKEVRIEPKYWDSYSDLEREQLIFHELGHCVFNLDHDDSIFMLAGYSCPNSIMRSYMFSNLEIEYCYIPEHNHYMEDINDRR